MKKILTVSLLLVFPLTFAPFGLVSVEAENPLEGKIIALDAGHGGTSLGATYPPNAGIGGSVYEKDVNIATIFALKTRLEGADAYVVLSRECDEEIPRRKDRVAIAEQECANLDLDGDGKADGRECDVLVSVHHNGNLDETYDGMMVIYNNKKDLVLATKLHDKLLGDENFDGLFKGDTTYDEGFGKGGYGMTVYFTPASLTEGYYVTNRCEAELFYPDTLEPLISEDEWNAACPSEIYGSYLDATEGTTISFSEVNVGACSYDFDYGPGRVNQEADALYQGLIDYFSDSSGNGGGNGGGGKCPPGNPDHPNCK